MDIALKQYSSAAVHISDFVKSLISLGIIGLAYMRLYHNGSIVNLASCPKWTDFYYKQLFEEHYQEKDIFDHLYIQEGISLWALSPHNQVWLDVTQKFNYGVRGSSAQTTVSCRQHSMYFFYYIRKVNIHPYFFVNTLDCITHARITLAIIMFCNS